MDMSIFITGTFFVALGLFEIYVRYQVKHVFKRGSE
jgi:hypothetical protein